MTAYRNSLIVKPQTPPKLYFKLLEVHCSVSRFVQTVENLLNVFCREVVSDALQERDHLRQAEGAITVDINAVEQLR